MGRLMIAVLVALCILSLLPAAQPQSLRAATLATASTSTTGIAPPPLPRSCGGTGTPIDYDQAVCCVNGYVYLNGAPTAGATVTISANGHSVTITTQASPDRPQPFFATSLDTDPLNVNPGDTVSIAASAGGQTKTTTFMAQPGGQQVDVVLPQSAVDAYWQRVDIDERTGYAIAYDEARGKVVLFGGEKSGVVLNDTWEWDGTTWTQRFPLVSPSVRSYHAMTYDAARQRVLLFGGAIRNDTWEWDGVNWIERTPTISPPRRSYHAMTYDAKRQRVVLFGGNVDALISGDVWEWDGTTWIAFSPAVSPPKRQQHSLIYDAAHQQVILFGGQGIGLLNDTWAWDGTSWRQLFSPTEPSPRRDFTMAYDVSRAKIVLIGGYTGQAGSTGMWEWNGITWMSIDTPLIPYNDKLFYDSVSGHITSLTINQTTIGSSQWDGVTWSSRTSSIRPPIRTNTSIAYETLDRSLLFGGRNGSTIYNTTYRWANNGWSQLTPATNPPARYSHRLAGNADGTRLLTFGGIGAGNLYLADTWVWNGTNWLQQSPTTAPSARAGYGLAFDRNRNIWVLFGGQNASTYLADTWEYDGTSWTQRIPTQAPSARSNATLTYDANRGRTVLIGGLSSGGYLGDVWEWDGTTWTNATPPQRIAARTGHAAAYDSRRNVVVVAGGLNSSGVLSDTWEWNGTFWRQRTTSPILPAIYNLAMNYDAQHDQMVAFGGENTDGVVNGTYLHQVTGTPTDAPPVATISRVNPRDARQATDTLSFDGRGADADSSDLIVAYRWTWQNGTTNTVLSTAPQFTKPASEFPTGEQIIRLEVQDNEGTWSPAVEQHIFIRDANGAVANGKTWTLLIYADADNNLDLAMGDYPTRSGMLARLKSAGAQKNVQVGILYDGPGANDTRRYTLGADGTWRTETLSEAQMNNGTTLQQFISWGRVTLPADYYALSIVDHANGVVGIAQDNTTNSNGTAFITPIALRTALQNATDDGRFKLDVLHYDGCSFGLFEDAAIADGLANYVVASPNTGWGIFAYDQYRRIAGTNITPRDYARTVAQTYATAVSTLQRPYTISVFDMARFAPLNNVISTFGNALNAYVQADPNARTLQLKTLRNSAQHYDSGGMKLIEPDAEDSYVDLVDFAEQVQVHITDSTVQSAASAVSDTVQGSAPFVLYESHQSGQFSDDATGTMQTYTVNLDHAHGLGIYYPPRSSASTTSAYRAYTENRLFHITHDSQWTTFIGRSLPAQLAGDASPMPNDTLIALLLPSGVALPNTTPLPTSHQQFFLPLLTR